MGHELSMLDLIYRSFTRVWSLLSRPQSARFVCADCERVEQCGSPPHDDCVHRLEQTERSARGAALHV